MAEASALQELQSPTKFSSSVQEEEYLNDRQMMDEEKQVEIESDDDDIIGNKGICS